MAANRNEGAWGEANREESGQGKININTASKEDLEQVQGIGSKRAEMIVQYRQQLCHSGAWPRHSGIHGGKANGGITTR